MLAGKQWHADNTSLHDALRPDLADVDNTVKAKIAEQVNQGEFDAIVLDALPEIRCPASPGCLRTWRSAIQLSVSCPEVTSATYLTHPTYFLLPCREKGMAIAHGWKLLETGGQSACASD